jgi:hypothetical protein
MNKKAAVLALASIAFGSMALAAPTADAKIQAKEYANSFAHKESRAVINYSIVGDTAYFGITIESAGWAGIGFNPTGTKKDNADVVMWFFKGDELQYADMHISSPTGAPDIDVDMGGKDDILTFAGASDGKSQVIEFSRKLKTGDKTDQDIKKGVNMLILAVGGSKNFTTKHPRDARWMFDLELK